MIPDWCELTYEYGPRGAIIFGYDNDQETRPTLCPLALGHHAWQPSAAMPWHWILEACHAVRPPLDPCDLPARDRSDLEFCAGCGQWFQSGWHMEEHDKICPNDWWD